MRIAVIGAGASGMMAAATLAELGIDGASVTLFDGNSAMGKKVAITGGGRCNATTGIRSKKELLSKYVRGADFLEGALGKFSAKRAFEWFAQNECPLKIEDDLRAFPVSDKGSDVVAVFERILAKAGTDLRLKTKVLSVLRAADGSFLVESERHSGAASSGVATLAEGVERRTEAFDAVIVATGGEAYAKTGSGGSGYVFARALGHSVTPLAPSLSAFSTDEAWCHEIPGLSLPNVRLALKHDPSVFSEGGFMFTHAGITGPSVFAFSAKTAFVDCSPSSPLSVLLVVDALKSFEDWDREFSLAFGANGSKELKNVLSAFFPRRLAETLPALAALPAEKKAALVSRDERRTLARLLSDGIVLKLNGRRPGEEFVTAGGVALSEIDPETMESKKVPNLYFTGEVLDVDGVTGGFNLQACWATGRAAGNAVGGTVMRNESGQRA